MIPTLAERSRRRRLRERAWGEERLTGSAVDGAPPVGLAPFLPQSRPEPPPSQGSTETAALAGPVERSGARVHRSAGAAVTAKPALELLLWLAMLLFDAGLALRDLLGKQRWTTAGGRRWSPVPRGRRPGILRGDGARLVSVPLDAAGVARCC